MGFELELWVLLVAHVLGTSLFDRFEVETPAWRKLTKWGLMIVLTAGVYELAGHWALLVPAAGLLAGTVVHMVWTKRHDIHPLRATPRKRYYELRGWQWPPA